MRQSSFCIYHSQQYTIQFLIEERLDPCSYHIDSSLEREERFPDCQFDQASAQVQIAYPDLTTEVGPEAC
jgi:hypothetical protein